VDAGTGEDIMDGCVRFILPDAWIKISPLEDTNAVNEQHEITATVQQNDGTGWTNAPDGTLVTFSLLNNSAGASFVPLAGNTCTTTVGVCSVFINTSTPGSVDIHATTTFDVAGQTLHRETDGSAGSSGDAEKTYVDGYITITPDEDTNPVGQSHTFTITAYAQGDAPDSWIITPTVTPAPDTQSDTCVSPAVAPDGMSASCTLTINNNDAGVFTASAEADLIFGSSTVSVKTDGVAPNSGDAQKTYVEPDYSFEKYINGNEADTLADAVLTTAGASLTFRYEVNNTGSVSIVWAGLTDDVFGDLTTECGLPKTIAVAGSAFCEITRTAGDFPSGKRNVGTASVTGLGDLSDPAWYKTSEELYYMIYLPFIVKNEGYPCGWQQPDPDEPANDMWESATPYNYGAWRGRTFWSPVAAPGWEGNDTDWYRWLAEWTGTHWVWPENLSSGIRVYIRVYQASGEPYHPLELLAYGEGRLEMYLEGGEVYYVKVTNIGGYPPKVGCYDLLLDP